MKLIKGKKKKDLSLINELDIARAVKGSIANIPMDQGFGDPSRMIEIMNSEEFIARFGKHKPGNLKYLIIAFAMSDPKLQPDDLESFLGNIAYFSDKHSVSENGFMIDRVTAIFSQMYGYSQELQIAEVRNKGKKKSGEII